MKDQAQAEAIPPYFDMLFARLASDDPAATVLGASIASGLFVRRSLDHLDLIAVLKSRE